MEGALFNFEIRISRFVVPSARWEMKQRGLEIQQLLSFKGMDITIAECRIETGYGYGWVLFTGLKIHWNIIECVSTRSRIVTCCINSCTNLARISISCWIHKIHPIPCLNGRASFVNICEKIDRVIKAPQCSAISRANFVSTYISYGRYYTSAISNPQHGRVSFIIHICTTTDYVICKAVKFYTVTNVFNYSTWNFHSAQCRLVTNRTEINCVVNIILQFIFET